jgi:hypothetical protein
VALTSLRVTRPNEENFINAPDFMGYDRWWAEMVGYWGKPGKASPGRVPLGVAPLVFETAATPEEFKEKYPLDGDTRLYLHASFSPTDTIAPVPSAPVTSDPITIPGAKTEEEGSSALWKYGGGGYFLGIVSTVIVMALWNSMSEKRGYEAITDSNIRI